MFNFLKWLTITLCLTIAISLVAYLLATFITWSFFLNGVDWMAARIFVVATLILSCIISANILEAKD